MPPPIFINADLRLPAQGDNIKNVEEKLNINLNVQHKSFLENFDGGFLCRKKILLFCTEIGALGGEDLISSNGPERGEDGQSLFFIGRDAGEVSIVMKKSEMRSQESPVYLFFVEDGALRKIGRDFREFLEVIATRTLDDK